EACSPERNAASIFRISERCLKNRMAFAIALALQVAAVLWFLRHRSEIRKIDAAFRSGEHASSSRRG
ncbi:MAG: hypothetical protein AAFO62_13010, partial [Pseudomonadota bacterium]